MKLPRCFTVFDSILKTHTNDTNTSQLAVYRNLVAF